MSADTGPAVAPRGVRKVFTTPSGELHTAAIGLDPTVGRCGFTAVVAPTGRGRSTTPTLVSGLEELLECEAVVPDESLDPREDTRDSVIRWTLTASAAAKAPEAAERAKTAPTGFRARAALGSGAVVAVPRLLPLAGDARSLGASACRVTLQEGLPTSAERRSSRWTPL
ncbi:hypothetical protein JEQ17_13340 [Streptomyces liliifuscus]|uniref:Uncharacterized protein n=1 Tax=Streptomyces liliifuscus TaxID=2797636 RepID=A0A7T7I3Q9_9ACTN|nr:hypothetical protein JEQ17_13340 [Streptomyces liliifuscus]